MKDRAPADAVNGNAVDEVRLSGLLPGAHSARKEAQHVGLYDRVTEPADIDADTARLLHWHKCYRELWELKAAFNKQHNR